jgi:hypothetical protein
LCEATGLRGRTATTFFTVESSVTRWLREGSHSVSTLRSSSWTRGFQAPILLSWSPASIHSRLARSAQSHGLWSFRTRGRRVPVARQKVGVSHPPVPTPGDPISRRSGRHASVPSLRREHHIQRHREAQSPLIAAPPHERQIRVHVGIAQPMTRLQRFCRSPGPGRLDAPPADSQPPSSRRFLSSPA